VSLNKGTHARDDITVPASVANLGGGFDTLAVAVQLYLRLRVVEVRDDGGATLSVVRSEPPVGSGNAIERAYHLMARWTGLRAPSVFVETESDIPMASGLGSSAAAAVAGLRMFERVTHPFSEGLLLAAATSLEGHSDNAAAAIHGGLISVVDRERDEPIALRWKWPSELRFIIATPSVALATSKARAVLADTLPRQDAVFNLQRVLSLVHALQTGDYGLLREGVRDRWHQRTRAALVPQLAEVLALNDPEILGSFLSGAGPSVALVARRDFERLEQLLISKYERANCPVTVRTLSVHEPANVAHEAFAAAHGGKL
jgi:homoserine kinase